MSFHIQPFPTPVIVDSLPSLLDTPADLKLCIIYNLVNYLEKRTILTCILNTVTTRIMPCLELSSRNIY